VDGSRQRILRATSALLSWQPQDADGEPSDPGTVTVQVLRSDSTELVAAGTATSGATTAARTIALSVAQTAQLDWLTAVWSVAGTVFATTTHEVVGGFFFSTADLRTVEPSTADASRDVKARILSVRAEVEAFFEEACSVAFVPRFSVASVSGGPKLVLPAARVRAIRWMARRDFGTGAYVPVAAATVANYGFDPAGTINSGFYDPDGFGDYYLGRGDYQVGYEHGYDAPPADVKRAALQYARAQLNQARSAIPDRATSMQLADGGSVTLATPGTGKWHTGIPAVDEVIRRYTYPRMLAG
jgi:hypothetical protein